MCVTKLTVSKIDSFPQSFFELGRQRTIRSRVAVEGIGLHTGEKATLVFRPAPADTGIRIVRSDMVGSPGVRVQADHVRATELATTIGCPEFSVSTVEHCLSAVAAFQIDNLVLEMSGPELPIGDGSARLFSEAILQVGFVDQDAPRCGLVVREPIFVADGDKHAYVMPYSGLRVTATIDFSHPSIGRSRLDVDINESSFAREIAPARTFGFLKDVEALRARGLAKGGSLENAIVLDASGVMNPEGLRFEDEFVRHKVLDALGDLVTLGYPLVGHVVLYKAGHDLMNKLVKKILASSDKVRSFGATGLSFQSEGSMTLASR